MAQLGVWLLLVAQCSVLFLASCQDNVVTSRSRLEDLSQFVLDEFNSKPDALYEYKAVRLLSDPGSDGSEDSDGIHRLRLQFAVACKLVPQDECFPKHLDCDVAIQDVDGEQTLIDEETKCSAPAEQQQAEQNSDEAMMAELGPFLLKPLIPLTESKPAAAVKEVVEEPVAVKKRGPCTGCETILDPSEQSLEQFIEHALSEMDKATEGQFKHAAVSVLAASKQVVGGIKYRLTLLVAETDCQKEGDKSRNECKASDNQFVCSIEILDRPWLHMREVLANNCSLPRPDDTENEVWSRRHNDVQGVYDYLDSWDRPVPSELEPEPDVEFVGLPQSETVDRGNTGILIGDEMYKAESDKRQGDAENIDDLIGQTEKTEGKVEDRIDDLIVRSETEAVFEGKKEEGQRSVADRIDDLIVQSEGDVADDEVEAEQEDPRVDGVESPEDQTMTDRRRRRRSLHDEFKRSVDSDPELGESLAAVAVETLDRLDADDRRRAVLAVSAVQQRTVADGTAFRIKLRVVDTACSEEGASVADCESEHVGEPKMCVVSLHRAAAAGDGVRVVKSECSGEGKPRQRRGVAVGGYAPANVSDPYIQDLASFAVSTLDAGSNSLYRRQVSRITSASQQVVAGLNVKLTIELAETSCRKDAPAGQVCEARDPPAAPTICHVSIWDRPWLNQRVITKWSCDPHERKRRSVTYGAEQKLDTSNPKVERLAQLAIAHLDASSNALYRQQLVSIVHAARQGAAGAIFRLTIETGSSTCRKGKPTHEECAMKEGSSTQMCEVSLWERPWLNETKVTSARCSPGGHSINRLSALSSNKVKRSEARPVEDTITLSLFENFLRQHNKSYSSREETQRRFRIFRANLKKIDTLRRTEQGTGRYGTTRFADLSGKEFRRLHLGLNPSLRREAPALPMAEIPDVLAAPDSFDWRDHGAVTPVKNQGMCGSCWAFSVTGNVEGQWAVQHGKLLSLSEQELVDCDSLDSGCEGGLPENAYKTLSEIGGLEGESDYPYDGADEKCHFDKKQVQATVVGGVNVTTNETQMAAWLAKNGPISIGINANAMQFYMGGVSHPWKALCSPENLDHGVLIVGYGTHISTILHRTLPYWTVKNSWGPSWGEKGYYRVYRGDGTCGVNMMATSAVVG